VFTVSSLLLSVLAQTSSAASTLDAPPTSLASDRTPSSSSPIEPAPTPSWRPRRFGVHGGINLTLTFDATIGRFAYAGVATQLTGLAWFFAQERNFNLSLLAFGGVGLPIIEREDLRFTADITPALGYLHAAPVNLLSVSLLAGVRVVHRSGFTFSVKLPLVGYAGAPDAQRGSLLMYYVSAIVTVPVITFGYSF
jgi:hypothetical protein